MATDEYGVPKDLARRASKRLGRFRKPVQVFVRRVNQVRWLERAGQPEAWDAEVLRVWSFDEAKRVEKAFRPVKTTVWNSLESMGKAIGRFELMEAAEEYWIARFDFGADEPSYQYDLLFIPIRSDLVGALRELILDDVVSIRFFREAVEWYEKGHWRCAIAEDGRRVVY